MARVVAVDGQRELQLTEGWELAFSAPDAVGDPAALDSARLEWLPAVVPGTAAQALRAAGKFSLDSPTPLHGLDVWYRCRFAASACQPGEARTLRFGGLATFATAWLNGEPVLESDNMFLEHEVDVSLALEERNWLHVCFRALEPKLAAKRPRPRWRPRMIAHQNLRFVRTTLLGHLPGWCPPVHAVGPWRGVSLVEHVGPLRVRSADLRTAVDGEAGVLAVELHVQHEQPKALDDAWLECGGVRSPFRHSGQGVLRADVRLEKAALWWPHTHGESALHAVKAMVSGAAVDLGRTGFRTVELDRAKGDFALSVNGVPVFARGACWSTPDVVALPGSASAYAPWLELAREAGMNMLRVGGTMAYEADPFFARCDELGILVWQDAMLANFDYPTGDRAFLASLTKEVQQLLERTQAHPSLAVVCGGSEIAQQAAMLGVPRAQWAALSLDEVLERLVLKHRADVPFVAHTPMGGELPFQADTGVTHYYGVGAYLRPLDDARRAHVRFASECLAFANVPAPATVAAVLAPGEAPVHSPAWKRTVPRDVGASWDFEDVREHYLKTLHGVDPLTLRYEEPQRYLELSRAVTGEVMEATFAEWRRPASTTRGGLVFLFQDLRPGAGWGVVDALGTPKAAYSALKRAFAPRALFLTDEGLNGLHAHLVNERPAALEGTLTVALYKGAVAIAQGSRAVTVAPRSGLTVALAGLLDSFLDTTYAYRFGPPAHEVTVARLVAPGGETLAEAFHLPRGPALPRQELGLEGEVVLGEGGWALHVKTGRFAQAVHVEDEHFRAADDWFHLAPGSTRVVPLTALGQGQAVPDGELHALNALAPARFRSKS